MPFELQSKIQERPVINSRQCVPGRMYKIFSLVRSGCEEKCCDLVYCIEYIQGNMLVVLRLNEGIDSSACHWDGFQFRELNDSEQIRFTN